MFEELETVALERDLPKHGLKAGDVGTVVLVYEGTPAREVEFITSGGATVAVLTLETDDLRPIGPDEMPRTRRLSKG